LLADRGDIYALPQKLPPIGGRIVAASAKGGNAAAWRGKRAMLAKSAKLQRFASRQQKVPRAGWLPKERKVSRKPQLFEK